MLVKIPIALAESLVNASRETYPREFIALIEGRIKDNVTELQKIVVLPSQYGRNFSSIRLDLLPLGQNIVATAHSHPSSNLRPSKQDLQAFARLADVHLIIDPLSGVIKAYNSEGKLIDIVFDA